MNAFSTSNVYRSNEVSPAVDPFEARSACLAFKPRHGGDYSGVGRIASKSLVKGKEAEEQKGYSFLSMEVEGGDAASSSLSAL